MQSANGVLPLFARRSEGIFEATAAGFSRPKIFTQLWILYVTAVRVALVSLSLLRTISRLWLRSSFVRSGAPAVVWAIGVYALLFGALLAYLGFKVRKAYSI